MMADDADGAERRSLLDRTLGPDDEAEDHGAAAAAAAAAATAAAPPVFGVPVLVGMALVIVVAYSLHKGLEYPELFRTDGRCRTGLVAINAVLIAVGIALVVHDAGARQRPVRWD